MATAAEVRRVLNQNQDKRKTPEYAELYAEYQQLKAQESSVYAPNKPDTDFFDQVEEAVKGVPAGIIGLAEIGAIGAATLLNEETELKVRGGIQSAADTLRSPFTADVGSEDLVGRKYGEALGSFVGLGLTSLIPGAGAPLALGLAGSMGAGEASERARAAGATEQERNVAALKGLGVGFTELIPLGKLRGLQESLGKNAFLNGIERIKRAAVAGGFEGAQEAAAGVLQNAIQRGYDPTQDLLNVEVAEEGGYGAAVGATVQALLDVAVPRKRGGAAVPELTETGRSQEEALLAYDDDVQETAVLPEAEIIPKPKPTDDIETTAEDLASAGVAQEVVAEEKTLEEKAAEEEKVIVKKLNGETLTGADAQIAARVDIQEEVARRQEEQTGTVVEKGKEEEKKAEATFYAIEKKRRKEEADKKKAEEEGTKAGKKQVTEGVAVDTPEEREARVIDKVLGSYRKDIQKGKKPSPSDLNKKLDAFLLSFVADPKSSTQPVYETESFPPDRLPAVKEKILQRIAELDAAEETKVTEGVKGATLPNLEEFVTEYSDLLARDPQDAKNYLTGKLVSGEINSEDEIAILEAVGGATTTKKPTTKKKITKGATLPNIEEDVTKEEATPFEYATRFKNLAPVATVQDDIAVKQISAVEGTVAKNKKRLGAGYNHAATYFNKFDRLEDAVEAITFDYANKEVGGGTIYKGVKASKDDPKGFSQATSPEEKAFMAGTGGANAEAAYNWIQNSTMSDAEGGIKEVARNTFENYKTKILELKKSKIESTAAEKLKEKRKKLKTDYVAGDASVKDVYAEFSEAEVTKLEKQRKQFETQKAAEVKAKTKQDADLAPSAVTTVPVTDEVKDSPTIAVLRAAAGEITEYQKEVANELARTNSYLSDTDRKQLSTLEAGIQELKTRQSKEGGLDSKTSAQLKGKEGRAKAIRAKAQDKARKTDDIREAEGRRIYGERAEQKDLEESYGEIARHQRKDDRKVKRETAQYRSYPLTSRGLSELTQPVSSTTNEALASNDLEGALNSVGADSTDKRLKNLAKKFAPLSSGTKVEIVKGLKDPRDNTPLAGLFDPKTNTVQLDSVDGLNTHALIHEVSHALGSAELAKGPKGSAFTKKITALYENTKDLLGNAYGAKDPEDAVDEFFSEAMGNEQFRMELARINPNGSPKSALTMFIDAVRTFLSSKLGLKFVGQSSSALSEVDALVDSIISPAPMNRNAEVLAMSSDVRGVERVMESTGNLYKSIKGEADASSNKNFVDDFSQFAADAKQTVIETFLGAIDLPGVAELSKGFFGSLGDQLHKIALTQRGDMQKADTRADVVANMLIRFRDKYGEAKYNKFAELIYNYEYGATINQIDPLIKNKSVAKIAYGNVEDKFERWVELKDNWDALSADTKGESARVYKILRNFYKQQFTELKDTLYNRVKNVADEAQMQALNTQVLEELFSSKALDVYFPLARAGRFKVEYTRYVNPNEPTASGYNMEMFSTKAQAKRRIAELKADKDITIEGEPTVLDTKGDAIGNYKSSSMSIIEEILQSVDQKATGAGTLTKEELAIKAEVRSKIVEVFVENLPETSFAKSLQTRKNTKGYEFDPLFAVQTKGYDLGRQIVRIQNTKKVNDIESKLIEDYKVKRGSLSAKGVGLYQELMQRASFIRNPPADLLWQTLNQGAFVYTIGFNASSAIVNLSQIPLFTLPYLAGEYQNTTAATAAITKASGIVGSSFSKLDVGIDGYYNVDAAGNYSIDEKKFKERTEGMSPQEVKKERQELLNMSVLVKRAADEGQLTKSFLMDELSLQKEAFKAGRERSGNLFRQTLDKITGISAAGFNIAERFNRQTTMVATYNLELDRISKGKKGFKFTEEQLNEAADKAFYVTQETNGGAFREVGPRLSQQGWKRVALMYKTYGFRMYQTMIKSGIRAVKGTTFSSDPKENARLRSIAIRQVVGWHLSSLFFAGVFGMPLYGAVTMAVDLLLLDDEEDDADTMVRKYLTELPFKGVVNQITNADIASRVRLTGLLIQSNRYNANASAEETIGFYIGGPALSTAKRFGRGVESLLDGEIERGIESMLPAGIANFIKAIPGVGRVAREGYTTRRGDPIYDDVTAGELASQMFGFAPLEYTRRIEENMNAKNVEKAITSKKSKILKRLYISIRTKNSAEKADALADMRKFNKRHPLYAILPKTVERSMKAHQRTSATMHNGVVLSPSTLSALRIDREGY